MNQQHGELAQPQGEVSVTKVKLHHENVAQQRRIVMPAWEVDTVQKKEVGTDTRGEVSSPTGQLGQQRGTSLTNRGTLKRQHEKLTPAHKQ